MIFMIFVILNWNSMIFVFFCNSLMEFNDLHYLHNFFIESLDFHDFHVSRIALYDFRDFHNSQMEF